MISPELEEIIEASYEKVRQSGQEYFTLNHLFVDIITHLKPQLRRLGVDVDAIVESAKPHLQSDPLGGERSVPQHTPMLSRFLDKAASYEEEYGPEEALIDMVKVEESLAMHYLSGVPLMPLFEEGEYYEEFEQEGNQEAKMLTKYTVELVALAGEKKIDPVIGRAKELERMLEVLSQKRKNNPILVGEPGVGKTAVVEALALKMVANELPASFAKSKIYALDMGRMMAGTQYRGEFEERLVGVIDGLKQEKEAILFIDEIHTLIGAGSLSGSSQGLDAANILKPALARGEISVIGATTFDEYRKVFEEDKALSRRFGKVDVDEPSKEEAFLILQGAAKSFGEHHGVSYSDEALRSAVELSIRHMPRSFLPDKALDIIDLSGAKAKLEGRQEEQLDAAYIKKVASEMLKIPQTQAQQSQSDKLSKLEQNLGAVIVEQKAAIEALSDAIKLAYAGLNRPQKPLGSFLFVGPTGVGKTALSRALASELGVSFERIDMSEYMEAHSVSRLIGTAPGYVGYGQGGQLSDAVRKNPHTVLLLDEIEKAHPAIMNILLQVMDAASITDGKGNKIDFSHVVLIMTSNLGTKEANVMGFEKDNSYKTQKAIEQFFSPEFRNRLDGVIGFEPLTLKGLTQVSGLEIAKLSEQLSSKNVTLTITQEAQEYIAKKSKKMGFGARDIGRIIDKEIKKTLAESILFGDLKEGGVANVVLKKEQLEVEVSR